MQELGENIKKDFPIFQKPVNGKPLVYLDSAASTQKPSVVIEAEKRFYEEYYANVHRGIYYLSEQASQAYESAREVDAQFIGANSAREIIFTKNATESINLVAYAWGRQNIQAGDEILLTEMEHHANLVPWQILAKEKKAHLKFIPIDKDFRLQLDKLEQLITKKTKLLAMTHMSNVLGTINPVADIIVKARSLNDKIIILVDGAQSVPHFPVDVKMLDTDFYVFSSHKMLGPTGVGVLYGQEKILSAMPPFLAGGDMISEVTYQDAKWNELPWKFEAGTPNAAGVIGFAAAINYLNNIGMKTVRQHESLLTDAALVGLSTVKGLKIYGPHENRDRGGVISFTIDGVHPHDLASILDEQGIAVRAGHHCAMPLHQKLGVEATSRASFYVYNTLEDVNALQRGIIKTQGIFGL
jgi:cysteine desulfurase/selenocysteine lyase